MSDTGQSAPNTALVLAFPARSGAARAFPTRPLPARAGGGGVGRFALADRDELARWERISGRYGWQVGAAEGPRIETGRDGREHIRIMLRAVSDDVVYFVAPEQAPGREAWTVLDRRGVGETWASLREALESICPTQWQPTLPALPLSAAVTPSQRPA